jgi:hypothetical protein
VDLVDACTGLTAAPELATAALDSKELSHPSLFDPAATGWSPLLVFVMEPRFAGGGKVEFPGTEATVEGVLTLYHVNDGA